MKLSFKEVFKENKMTLLVSLPENNYEFAKIAWESGADLIKVHINVFHTASQNNFGTIESEYKTFTKILKDSPIPVGIVIGNSVELAEESLNRVIDMGFDFISLYGFDMPPILGINRSIETMYAINHTYSLEEIKYTANQNSFDCLEMSVLPSEKYGTRLNLRNLLKYKAIKESVNVPVVLPTQHLIKEEDIKELYWAGIDGLMIGAIVTSKNLAKFKETIMRFRKEINKL